MHQEITAHKRIIETVFEKANALVPVSQAPSNIEEKVASVNQRYEKLFDISLKGLNNLEVLSEVFQQFYDLQKLFKDYQKEQWDRLAGYNDYTGNKAALETRLAKLVRIQDNLGEGEIKLNVLEKQLDKITGVVSPRSRETMERDLNNHR